MNRLEVRRFYDQHRSSSMTVHRSAEAHESGRQPVDEIPVRRPVGLLLHRTPVDPGRTVKGAHHEVRRFPHLRGRRTARGFNPSPTRPGSGRAPSDKRPRYDRDRPNVDSPGSPRRYRTVPNARSSQEVVRRRIPWVGRPNWRSSATNRGSSRMESKKTAR